MPVGQLFSLDAVDGRKVVLLYSQLHDVVYPTTFSRRNIISKARRYETSFASECEGVGCIVWRGIDHVSSYRCTYDVSWALNDGLDTPYISRSEIRSEKAVMASLSICVTNTSGGSLV